MTEEEKAGFSYQSPEKKKKAAAKLLFLELGALAVVVSLIIGLLIYLRVIPLSIFPQSLNQKLESQYKIEAVSDINGYTIKIADEKGLIDLISKWGVFTKEYGPSIYKSGDLGGKPLEKITIRLTDKVQSANRYSKDEGETFYTSSYVKLNNGEMEILVHLDKKFFDTQKEDSLGLNTMVQVVTILYKMTQDVYNPDQIKNRDKEIGEIIRGIVANNKNYFTVVRN